MPKTRIIPVGWETAGHRFQGMLAEQLRLLVADGTLAAPAPDADGGDAAPPAQDPACLYRFGATPAGRGSSSLRQVVFWPPGGTLARSGRPGPMRRDTVVVTSEWARGRAIAAGAAPARVTVVTPGVDGATFSPLSRAERDVVRAGLGLAGDETVLLAVAESVDDGGLDLVFRALARLRGAGHRVRLLVKADGPGADCDEAVRRAAADEPGLDWAAALSAVATLPGDLAPADWRRLYGAADILVSPARAGTFDFAALEALACGCPVVATRGGAGDDILDDDLAWRIPGALRRDAAGGAFIEPDLDAFVDALAEIAAGRGFDRLRFAAARIRLLGAVTWERSARALGAVLTGEEAPGPARPTLLHGLPQPTRDRFRIAPARDLAALRRMARAQLACPGPEALSIVVQGPCLREATEPGAPSIDEALASIRRRFPGAQIVVSTWIGSDIDGLDADDIVLSPDPGPLAHPLHLPNNVNRMVTSTANGLAAATRTFCIKTRNDVLFASDALMRHLLTAAPQSAGLERRVWAMASRIETSLRPYHPSDMLMFGLTEDLRRLWDVPALSTSDMFIEEPPSQIERMSSEQAVFVSFLNGAGVDVRMAHGYDGQWDVVAGSLKHMLATFDAIGDDEMGISLPPRFQAFKKPEQCYTRQDFDAVRAEFHDNPLETCTRVYRAFHQTVGRLSGHRPQASS